MTARQPSFFDEPGAQSNLPPIGAWVRVRTNAGDQDGSFLGCVVSHYAKPERPELFYAVNRTGGIEATPAEVAAVQSLKEVEWATWLSAGEIQQRTAQYLAEYQGGAQQ